METAKHIETGPAHGYPITHPDKLLYPEQGITKQQLPTTTASLPSACCRTSPIGRSRSCVARTAAASRASFKNTRGRYAWPGRPDRSKKAKSPYVW